MQNPELNDKLRKLDSELGQVEPTSDQTRVVVNELKQEIQPIIEQPDLDHSHRYKSLDEMLNHALLHLQVEHPRLSAAIQSVLDELAAVGI